MNRVYRNDDGELIIDRLTYSNTYSPIQSNLYSINYDNIPA